MKVFHLRKILFILVLIPYIFYNCKSTPTQEKASPQPPIQEESSTTDTKELPKIELKVETDPQDSNYIQDLVLPKLTQPSFWNDDFYGVISFDEFWGLSKLDEPIEPNSFDIPFMEACIFYEINKLRNQKGIPPVKYSKALKEAAKRHSKAMVELNFYSHESPIFGEENPKKRLMKYGIDKAIIAEHLYIATSLQYQPGRLIIPPEQNAKKVFLYESNKKPIPSHTYRSFAENVVKDWTTNLPTYRNLVNKKLEYSAVGMEHYKDKKFHNLDRFKITHLMSSEPGSLPE